MTLHKIGARRREHPSGNNRWIGWSDYTEYHFDDVTCSILMTEYRLSPRIGQFIKEERSKITTIVLSEDRLDKEVIGVIKEGLKELLCYEKISQETREFIYEILKIGN